MDKIVYVDLMADTGIPYYVGAGGLHRLRKDARNRQPLRVQAHAEHGTKTIVIAEGLSKEDAFDLEELVISECKRIGINLVNQSSGGAYGGTGCKNGKGNKSCLGQKWDDDDRKTKLSKRSLGNKYRLGSTMSDEQKHATRNRMLGNTHNVGYRNSLGYKWTDEQRARASKAASIREANKRNIKLGESPCAI